MDKKDPIQQAKEEYARLLKEKINEKKSELKKIGSSDPDVSDAMSEFFALTEQKQREEKELLLKKKILQEKKRREIEEKERQLTESKERPEIEVDTRPISEEFIVETNKSERDTLLEALSKLEEEKNTGNRMDQYVQTVRDDRKKVQESADLMGGDEKPVTRQELQALKVALSSMGGGGVGDITDLVTGTPADGQTIVYNSTTNQYEWTTVAGVGGDSGGGLDSAEILNLLGINDGDTLVTNNGDSSVIWNILNVDSGDTFITNTNIYNTLGIDSNAQIITNSGGDSNSIWTILNVDSADTLLTIANLDSYQYTDSDVIALLNDSGVQNILPQLDSAFDLGDSARRWRDIWLSGSTIHLGDVDISSVGDSGAGVYANGRRLAYLYETDSGATGGLDSAQVIRLIDSALDSTGASGYTTADHDSDTLAQVDSAYVQARVTFPVDNIDSAYVASKIDSALDSLGVGYTTANHDSDTLVQVDSAYIAARLPDLYDTPDHDSDTLVQVDSAYVQARQIKYLDSAQITNLIDSALDSLGAHYTTADHDSDTLVQVDSAYVRARVKTDQNLSTTDIVTFDQVYANLDGAIEFKANNRSGVTILKGQPVYINGVDGNKPTIALADANDPDKMPAFGLLLEDANDNADAIVVTFGTLKDVDTSAFNLGDTLYIGTTPGTLVTTPPAGVNSLIQNIGRVIRSHGSTGSIKVGGAGRTNATPNLSAGQIFYGNDSDRAVPTLATDVFDSDYINSLVDNPNLHELADVQIDSTTLEADEFLQWNGSVWTHRPLTIETSLTFKGSIDVTADSAPTGSSGALYVNTGDGAALASWTGVAGDSFQSGQTVAWSDSDAQWYQMGVSTSGSILEVRAGSGISVDDSDAERPVVEIDRNTTDQWYLDSAEAIILIDERIPVIVDSAYVNLRADHYTRTQFESDALEFVDSAYINARSNHYTTADHDSDTLVQVDSAYINARVNVDSNFVNVTGDTMTGDLNIDSANLTVNGGGSVRVLDTGKVVSNKINSVGNSNLQLERNSERKLLLGTSAITADKKIKYNSAYNRDSYTSDLVGVDSYTLMPKWYIDSAVGVVDKDEFVNVAGDSMTGKLFAPAIQITQDSDNNGRTILTFSLEDSDHSVEVVEGTVDYDLWVNGRMEDTTTYKVASLAYSDTADIWVAFGDTQWTSSDGDTWVRLDPTIGSGWKNVIWDGSQFVAIKAGQSAISSDGITWTTGSGPSQYGNFYGLAYDGTTYITPNYKSGGVYKSTDGLTWSSQSSGIGDNSYSGVAFGNSTWVLMGRTTDGTGAVRYSTDGGSTWTSADATNGSYWRLLTFGNGRFVSAANYANDGSTNWIQHSADGITWTASNVPDADQGRWTALEYVDGVFILLGETGDNSGQFKGLVSPDGINWTPILHPASGSHEGIAYGQDKIISAGYRNEFSELYHVKGDPGFYFDGDLIATRRNLQPLIDRVNELSFDAEDGVFSMDSDPFDFINDSIQDSSFSATNTIRNGRFWYNTATSTLSIRDSGTWKAIGAGSSSTLNNTDSLPEGDSNLYYTTARHDSDTLVQVDSAYVQARQLLGGSVTVDSVAPSPAQNGQLWYDNTSGVLHIRDSGVWDSINAQDSGAYLLLSGGTITGPLNIDSGGIQFGPDSDRIKLYTGFSTFATPSDYNDSVSYSWDSAAGAADVPEGITINDSTGRIVATDAQNIYISDDFGQTWREATNDAVVVQARQVKYFPPLGTQTEGIYLAARSNGGTSSGTYFSYDADSWQAADFSLVTNPDRVNDLFGDFGIYRGLDDSDNPIYYMGTTYNRGYYRSIPGSHGTQYEYRSGQNGIVGRFPAASTGFRNDTMYQRGIPAYSFVFNKWIMIAGGAQVDQGNIQGQRVWTSTDSRTWEPTSVGGYAITNTSENTEPLATEHTDYIEDHRTGTILFYANRPNGNRAVGSIVTTDGGTTWFNPKFKTGDTEGARSVLEVGTSTTHVTFEIYAVDYDENAGIFYAMGRSTRLSTVGIGSTGPLREYFSTDLVNWVMGPLLSSSGIPARGGLFQLPSGEFMRAGSNASGTGDTFSVSDYGVVTEGVGSLKFGNDVVLTSDNYNRYIPSIEPLPSDIETSGLVFYPNGGYVSPGIGGWGNVGFSNDEVGRAERDFYIFGNKMESANVTWISPGRYQVRFADWNVTDNNYIVTATIEAEGIYTASARTAMIYLKSADGFDVILQRTDTSGMADADVDIISVSLTIVSKV